MIRFFATVQSQTALWVWFAYGKSCELVPKMACFCVSVHARWGFIEWGEKIGKVALLSLLALHSGKVLCIASIHSCSRNLNMFARPLHFCCQQLSQASCSTTGSTKIEGKSSLKDARTGHDDEIASKSSENRSGLSRLGSANEGGPSKAAATTADWKTCKSCLPGRSIFAANNSHRLHAPLRVRQKSKANQAWRMQGLDTTMRLQANQAKIEVAYPTLLHVSHDHCWS